MHCNNIYIHLTMDLLNSERDKKIVSDNLNEYFHMDDIQV